MKAVLRDDRILRAGGNVGSRHVPRIIPKHELHRQRSKEQKARERAKAEGRSQ